MQFAIVKYKNLLSILTIQSKYKVQKKFSFTEVETQDIEGVIFDLEKASHISNILTMIIKENVHVFPDFLNTSINCSIKCSFCYQLYPKLMKEAC